MSTVKSSSANLTLNADGSGNDIKFQSNAVEKASLTDAGVFLDINSSNVRSGRKNIIINGAMSLDERNNGAEIIPTNDTYTIDRWKYNSSQASKLKVQQNAQAISGAVGFKNYLGVTVNSAYTLTASDNFMISQAIEGFNTSHLEFGTSNAKTITISFWVQSSLTGTFSGSLQNSAENRSYPFSYAISSADTWEQKTITVTGDTSGTWIGATNGKGLRVWFSLGMGSDYTGTANQWNAAQDFAASSATVELVENAAAQWKITGVQLEVGSTATEFEHRSYGEELALCERYYKKEAISRAYGYADAQGNLIENVAHRPEMRDAPTITSSDTNVGSGTIYSDTVNKRWYRVGVAGGTANSASYWDGTFYFDAEL